ncbi:MAG TPA: trypsin, partial [Brevundimonas sp.]|nr:trypsin [Brevundimonas sp.]
NGEVKRGQTGAIFGSLNAERARELHLGIVRGAVVADVGPGSPAERAGLRHNDVITRLQGRPVANAGSVNATVGIAAPGSDLSVSYLRDGRDATTSLRVETPSDQAVTIGARSVLAYGATLRNQDGGAQVVSVQAGSATAQADLTAGDLITAVNGAPVADARAVATALQSASGAAVLTVSRGGETQTVTLNP